MQAFTSMDGEWFVNNFLHGILFMATFICIQLPYLQMAALSVSPPDSPEFDVDSFLNLSYQSDPAHFDLQSIQAGSIAGNQPVHVEEHLRNFNDSPLLKHKDKPVNKDNLSRRQKRRLAVEAQGIEAIKEMKRKKSEENRIYRERMLKKPRAFANYKEKKRLWSKQHWIKVKNDPQKHATIREKNKKAWERYVSKQD